MSFEQSVNYISGYDAGKRDIEHRLECLRLASVALSNGDLPPLEDVIERAEAYLGFIISSCPKSKKASRKYR